jgi:hypothetical protein
VDTRGGTHNMGVAYATRFKHFGRSFAELTGGE